MYDPKSLKFVGDGYIVHKDCYQVAKEKYGNFTIENIRLAKINYGKIKKYQQQEVPFMKFFSDGNEYMLESPLKNDENKTRILKLKHPITNVSSKKKSISQKDRPSPSESATLFKVGTKKKGNDGKMWIIKTNKNNINRWARDQ